MAEGLKNREHKVVVFCQKADPELSKSFETHLMPYFFEKPRWLNSLIYAISSHFAISRRSVDIIYSHERTYSFDVLVAHCPCFISKWAEKKGPKALFHHLATFFSPRQLAYKWLERKQFHPHPNRKILAVSNWVKRDIKKCYPQGTNNIDLCPPGVHLPPRPCQPPQEQFNVLFVGTEFRRKGLDAALHGFAKANIPHSRMRIAGGGKPETYLKLCEKLDILDKVDFLGVVSHVDSLYQESHVFLLPTLLEPFGMAPLEAMSYGLPIIISSRRFSGFAESLNPDDALILDDPLNSDKIAHHLNSLTNAEQWKKLSSQSLKVAESMTWEHSIQKTEEVLTNIYQKKTSL